MAHTNETREYEVQSPAGFPVHTTTNRAEAYDVARLWSEDGERHEVVAATVTERPGPMSSPKGDTPAEIAARIGEAAKRMIATRDCRVWAHNARQRQAMGSLYRWGLVAELSAGPMKTDLGRAVAAELDKP